MQLCRGPLPDGHPYSDVVYFCPDQDIAAQACNLNVTPVLHKFEFTSRKAVLLDAHRAPDEWYGLACKMDNLTVQGDPDAFRPMSCNLFASALNSCPVQFTVPKVHLRVSLTLTEALEHVLGKSIILVSNHTTRDEVFNFLRPNGPQCGDGIEDMHMEIFYCAQFVAVTCL